MEIENEVKEMYFVEFWKNRSNWPLSLAGTEIELSDVCF